MASKLIVGARTNLFYDQIAPAKKMANLTCTICNTRFNPADRVHDLACHVFHRKCLNPILSTRRLGLIQAAGDQDPEVGVEKKCPRADCRQPIEFHEANFQKGLRLFSRLETCKRPDDLALMNEVGRIIGSEAYIEASDAGLEKAYQQHQRYQGYIDKAFAVFLVGLAIFWGYRNS